MLGCLLASPTVVEFGGVPRLVDRLRLGDFALLLSEGSIALGRDPDSRDVPEWASDEFYDWLTGAGVGLFLWCVLRRNWPGLTPGDCEAIADRAEAAEVAAIYRAAMRRRAVAGETPGQKSDIARHRWGRTVRLLRASHSYPAISELTLDQVDLDGTDAERADPEADREEAATIAEMQRMWEQQHGARAAPAVVPDAVPDGVSPDVAAELAEQGLAIVPEPETPTDEHG